MLTSYYFITFNVKGCLHSASARNHYELKPETEVVFEETTAGVLINSATSERLSQLKAALLQSKGSAARSSAALMQLKRGDD